MTARTYGVKILVHTVGGSADWVKVEVQAVAANAVATSAVGLRYGEGSKGHNTEDAGNRETHIGQI